MEGLLSSLQSWHSVLHPAINSDHTSQKNGVAKLEEIFSKNGVQCWRLQHLAFCVSSMRATPGGGAGGEPVEGGWWYV